MITNKKWETLLSVIAGMLIVWLVLASVTAVMSSNYALQEDINRNNKIFILQSNTTNIIRSISIDWINQWEIFYLKKDWINNTYSALTWSTNEFYKYINYAWIGVWSWELDQTVYTRLLYLQKIDNSTSVWNSIIKADIRELIKK